MALPLQLPWDQAQTKWKSQIDPVLVNPLLQGQLLSQVSLINGTTVVNHKLGRNLVGWFVVGINAAATIYDSQTMNQTPQTTLVLVSNAACTVNLWVF
jgi:hypothetical protein